MVSKDIASAIAAYVLQAWVDGKDGVAADEIAAGLGVPVGRVRRAINDGHGTVRGVRYAQGERVTYSRNYPGMQAGVVKVGIYYPDHDALRAEVRRLRAAMGELAEVVVTQAVERAGDA